MGVYINREMPKSCSRCFCMASCRLWKNIMHPEFNRHRNCPLVSVPPHGRLIDADALKNKRHWTDDFYETEYVEVEDIDAAPTIIPAEEARRRDK